MTAILCQLSGTLVATAAAQEEGLLGRMPFYGEQPFATGGDRVALSNQEAVASALDGEGLVIGAGIRPEVAIGEWDVSAGTIAFWLAPVTWEVGTFHLVGMRDEGQGVFHCQKAGTVFRCFASATTPGADPAERASRIALAQVEGLDAWPPGEWHHVAIAWRKDVSFAVYVDGELISEQVGYFPWPTASSGLWLGFGNPARTRIKDLHVYARPLMPGEIGALAGQQAAFAAEAQPNIVPVGLTQSAPRIDGKIEADEYPTSITGLIDAGSHALYPEYSAVHTAADASHLYIAARIGLPPEFTPTPGATERDDPRLIASDSFQLFIRPDVEVDQLAFSGAYFCIGPDGTLYDAYQTIDHGPGGGNTRDPGRVYEVE
ncbi:MAG: LamG domain-containing protein [Candidatus Marinimicrobia bacterium]|nr:LamG domain-containing protein [Candidatus Neomarinimicrobiota bacterium]